MAPDLPEAARLLELFEAWRRSPTTEARQEIWHEMLEIYSEQVFSIGIIAAVPQPVVAREDLRNLPEEAVFNWEPGAQFGIHRPTPSVRERRGGVSLRWLANVAPE